MAGRWAGSFDCGFGVAMFTFDAFAFTQATFVFWILISLSGCLLLADTEEVAR